MASGRSTRPPSGPRGKNPVTQARGRSGGGGGSRRAAPPSRGKNPVAGARRRTPSAGGRKAPWGVIGAVAVLLVLVAVIGFFLFNRNSAVSPFRVSEDNPDPSLAIPGVVTGQYTGQNHVDASQQVAYDRSPPFGGPHDNYWAACTGTVYERPVRTENMVHSLEHGAVWIAYDPARVNGSALDTLRSKVQGVNYTMMSPYPGLDQPISLQSWGHELKLADAADPRVDQFIQSLKQNPNTHPESGASCDALGPGYFDVNDPPPFQPLPAVGPNVVGMDFKGAGTPG